MEVASNAIGALASKVPLPCRRPMTTQVCGYTRTGKDTLGFGMMAQNVSEWMFYGLSEDAAFICHEEVLAVSYADELKKETLE